MMESKQLKSHVESVHAAYFEPKKKKITTNIRLCCMKNMIVIDRVS